MRTRSLEEKKMEMKEHGKRGENRDLSDSESTYQGQWLDTCKLDKLR